MRLLLLGGTNEARLLARELHQRGVDLIYSIAGLVRQPDLPCEVISGGFSQFGGLASYLRESGITRVLDATHPYAVRMSRNAVEATSAVGIPCWRYLRPAWSAQENDNWHEFANWRDLELALIDHQSVLFTMGRLDQDFVETLYHSTMDFGQKQWQRSATKPAFKLPPSMTWIESIGPFRLDDERELMQRYAVDALVSKNSGGDQAAAKLEVARERGIPVYMLRREALPAVDREFDRIEDCCEAILEAHAAGTRDAD